jgi:2-polyprenyl-6-methoxyphenol hydroxylase-like FAD-dependent oxidoreductase
MMLAGELTLAGVDVAIVERRASAELVGSRAGDQRGIADRFLAQGQAMQVAGFAHVPLDISDFPTRHNYGLALWQKHFERILAGWIEELAITVYRGREVTGFAQVDIELSDGQSLRAHYLVGCDGGRSVVRKAAGIAFPGWDPTIRLNESWASTTPRLSRSKSSRQLETALSSAKPETRRPTTNNSTKATTNNSSPYSSS